jgi:hypothetical protein
MSSHREAVYGEISMANIFTIKHGSGVPNGKL